MSLRKRVSTVEQEAITLDRDLITAFNAVKKDIQTISHTVHELASAGEETLEIVRSQDKDISKLLREIEGPAKVGAQTGRTHTTLNGRVKAISDHLGLEFKAIEKKIEVTPAHTVAVKTKKKSTKK